MKKKVFILLIILFTITGCSGSYNLEIYNNKVTEETYIWYDKSEIGSSDPYDKTLSIASKYSENADFLSYDKKVNLNKNELTGIKLVNAYTSIDDYKDYSLILGNCYNAYNFTNYKDYITIKTSKEFTCLDQIEELDSVDIVIKSNHKLKETNADSKKGYTYTWHITKDNYKDRPITLKLYSDKYVWNYNNEVFKRLGLIILIIGGTLLIGFTGNKIFMNISKNKNRI